MDGVPKRGLDSSIWHLGIGEIKSWILVRGLQQDDGNLNRVQNDFFSTVGRCIAWLLDLNLDIGQEDWKTS